MENLTNFDTLIYIYLAMTIGTLIYPIELWFRVNFVNFIFMLIFTSFLMVVKIDITGTFNFALSTNNLYLFAITFGIVILGIFNFKKDNDIVKVDSYFLGFIPFFTLYELIFINLNKNNLFEINFFLIIVGFFILYILFIHTKLEMTLPFSVKHMADKDI